MTERTNIKLKKIKAIKRSFTDNLSFFSGFLNSVTTDVTMPNNIEYIIPKKIMLNKNNIFS